MISMKAKLSICVILNQVLCDQGMSWRFESEGDKILQYIHFQHSYKFNDSIRLSLDVYGIISFWHNNKMLDIMVRVEQQKEYINLFRNISRDVVKPFDENIWNKLARDNRFLISNMIIIDPDTLKNERIAGNEDYWLIKGEGRKFTIEHKGIKKEIQNKTDE